MSIFFKCCGAVKKSNDLNQTEEIYNIPKAYLNSEAPMLEKDEEVVEDEKVQTEIVEEAVIAKVFIYIYIYICIEILGI